jgi:enterochelin esterase-like enzyme
MRPQPALIFFVVWLTSCSVSAQDYSSFTATIQKLYSGDTAVVNTLWQDLVDRENIPLVEKDSVAFLYRGEAKSVVWMGDFNRWGSNRTFPNAGKNIPGTDIWILRLSFPQDARLDYKIVVNENHWILDPVNPDHQWSGVGGGSPNSELRMPEWKEDPITLHPTPGLKRGTVEKDMLFVSKALGYQITYNIYLPQSYKPGQIYPVIYVTDGYEYMHERLGNMVLILDNLIHTQKIKPVIAVFIDHREPVNRSNNRRMQELNMNEAYLKFLTIELIPLIEKNHSVSQDPAQRAILGTSMGGLSAAYFAFAAPETFGLAGIQSPAFWFKPDIYKFCDNPENPPVKTFMTTGSINDTEEGTKKMKAILEKNTCNYQYKSVAQGHSWGNWRDLIDDILIYFFPA